MKFANAALQFAGDFVRILVGRESDRRANCGPHAPGSRRDSLALFQIKKSMQIDWNNGNVQLFREQANARTKRNHLSVFSRFAFWKDQYVPAAVSQIAREGKAAQEARLLRQRENIKET